MKFDLLVLLSMNYFTMERGSWKLGFLTAFQKSFLQSLTILDTCHLFWMHRKTLYAKEKSNIIEKDVA